MEKRVMKKNKVILTRTGEEYTCKYLLDAADVVDTKVDMGMSGRFPQIIPYTLEEKEGQRTFVYQIGERMQMTEFLKKEINKKQMLTLLYNVLSALETFGMNMISLSYVAKDIQYIFVNPETLEVSFIVAAVDKEITDLNEVRDFVKAIICDATYFEMDRDNYVARLISFTNRRGTFSISDMKKYVDNLLLDMGIHIEEEKKQEVKNKLKTITQGQKTDKVITLMANTFCALCSLADWDAKNKKIKAKESNKAIAQEDKKIQEVKTPEEKIISNSKKEKLELHYDIQIHLPETRDEAVYDAIFSSMKKHLF